MFFSNLTVPLLNLSPGGSFRHFLWQVCKELQSSALSLLLPCPSAAANRNKVRFLQSALFCYHGVLFWYICSLNKAYLSTSTLSGTTKLISDGVIWTVVCLFSSGEVHPDTLPNQLCRRTVVAFLWSASGNSHPCRCATSFGSAWLLLEGSGGRVPRPRAGPAGSRCAHLQLCQEVWKCKGPVVCASCLQLRIRAVTNNYFHFWLICWLFSQSIQVKKLKMLIKTWQI